jgi:hypothetical protein
MAGRGGCGAIGEIEPRVLRREREIAERFLFRQDIAEGHAFVVGAEDEVDAAPGGLLLLERYGHLVIVVGDRPSGAKRILPGQVT